MKTFSILVNLSAESASASRTRFGCERAFMQWSRAGGKASEKQNNMSKNKCTKDISGIFFKWNISLLLATATAAQKPASKRWQAKARQQERRREWDTEREGERDSECVCVRRLICHFLNDFCKAKQKQADNRKDKEQMAQARRSIQPLVMAAGRWCHFRSSAAINKFLKKRATRTRLRLRVFVPR